MWYDKNKQGSIVQKHYTCLIKIQRKAVTYTQITGRNSPSG